MEGELDLPRNPGRVSRREFLRNFARLGGGLLALPLISVPELSSAEKTNVAARPGVAKSPSGPHKIGVLLPESFSHPGLGASFLAGMRLYLDQAGQRRTKLVTDSVGSGAQNVQQRVETMLKSEQVDLLVGLVNPSVAASLHVQLEAAATAFIASNLGENVPRKDDYSPYIFHHTLGLWQSNWALGAWAAANLGRRAVMLTSFHDSGFDALYAFRLGFEGAGGKVIAATVTHLPNGTAADLTTALDSIRQNRPDLVFASYSGQPAADLLTAYTRAGLSGIVPLVGTAFLADDSVLSLVHGAAEGVRTALSWAVTLDRAENRSFLTAYKAQTGKAANAFALLGYETGYLIADAYARSAGGTVLEALATASFSGPRGAVSIDRSSNATRMPLYLQQVSLQGSALRNVVLSELPSRAEADRQIAALSISPKTGWLGTYLCV